MQDAKSIIKELYLSLDDENLDDKESAFYELLINAAITKLATYQCTTQMKNQILGEMVFIGRDVIEECSTIC